MALIDRSDAAHAASHEILDTLERFELVTTEAAVTEASYLLDHSIALQVALQRLLATGRPRVESPVNADRLQMAELMQKYADRRMDYADATLVALAKRLGTNRIFTLDRRDFAVYRIGGKRFEIVP